MIIGLDSGLVHNAEKSHGIISVVSRHYIVTVKVLLQNELPVLCAKV